MIKLSMTKITDKFNDINRHYNRVTTGMFEFQSGKQCVELKKIIEKYRKLLAYILSGEE